MENLKFNIEHQNPQSKERIAKAPYNFVQLPHKVVEAIQPPDHDKYDPELNTGYIDCLITTETPMYIRGGMDPDFFRENANTAFRGMDENQKREMAKFFFTQDKNSPAIPGSSIRGMTRALLEIASYGKVQWVTNDKIGYRAVGDKSNLGKYYRDQINGQKEDSKKIKRQKTGYLSKDNGDWYIVPACQFQLNGQKNDFLLVDDQKIDYSEESKWKFGGKKVYFTNKDEEKYCGVCDIYINPHSIKGKNKVTEVSFEPKEGYKRATLIVTGYIKGKKNHCIIGLPDEEAERVKIPDKVIQDYKAQMTNWQKENVGNEGRGVLEEGYPVFYKQDWQTKEVVMIGHTLMFRFVYKTTPFDHIPSEVSNEGTKDMVDAIFGYASNKDKDKKKDGYAGRVHFSDGVLLPGQKDIWLDDVFSPHVLATPKPSTFQHYLTQQEPDNNKKLDHYDSPPPHDSPAAIRGHKLYWHKGNVGIGDIKADDNDVKDKSDQYTLIKPVRSGVRFKSRIYFENLRDEELGGLLWVLTLPNNCRHSLGMGKPYGMGAVKIETTLYKEDRIQRYKKLFDGDGWLQAVYKDTPEKYKDAFEEFILCNISSKDKNNENDFYQLKRIKMLLKMLEWPGPDKNDTSYMEIDEFKERKVLPDPLHIRPKANTSNEQKANTDPPANRKPSGNKKAPGKSRSTRSKPPEYGISLGDLLKDNQRKEKD